MVKWIGLALVAVFVYSWFRNGGMNFAGQATPGGWGSGMMYGPGANPYAYRGGSQWSIGAAVPMPGNSQDGPLTFNIGNSSW